MIYKKQPRFPLRQNGRNLLRYAFYLLNYSMLLVSILQMSNGLLNRSEVVGSNNAFMGIALVCRQSAHGSHMSLSPSQCTENPRWGIMFRQFFKQKRRNKSSKIVLIKKKCDKGWTARVGGGRVVKLASPVATSPPPFQLKRLVIYGKN